ncbi:hypothetical protein ACPUER_36740, partial [Burkholderia sp. DN3021]|uniref:hypothetical protein n=1 Tax=Burkholderia sp. DN3021 TaxID=3410137 RepID=UPI003C7B846C
LTQQVQTELAQQGTEVGEVKGYDTYVKVDPQGHKQTTTGSDPQALPNPLTKLVARVKEKFKSSPMDPELADYIKKKKEVNETLLPEDVDALIRATETIREVRKNIKRGNVTSDLEETGRKARRDFYIVRTLNDLDRWPEIATDLQEIDWRVRTATAAFYVHSGNCGEHAACAFVEHGKRIRPGEKVATVTAGKVTVGDEEVDHDFVMFERKGRPAIVIDPWQNGPAVLHQDFSMRNVSLLQTGPKMSYEDRLKYLDQQAKFVEIMSGQKSKIKEIYRNVADVFKSIDNNNKVYAPSYSVDLKRFIRNPRANRVAPR